MQQKKFRFGLWHGMTSSKSDWLDDARKVEDLGYDILLVGEHVFMGMAPQLALLAAADVTKTLRVGSYLFGNDLHHPLMLAKEAATLDALADGRFEFGIGTGWYSGDYASSGIPFDPPLTRINRLEEAVQIYKKYFNGEKFEFNGKYYQVKEDNPLPKTVQKPLPITMGGGGKRMLSLAARIADVVGYNPRSTREGWLDMTTVTREATQQKVDWIRQAAGERLDQIRLSMYFVALNIVDSQAEAEQVAAQGRKDWGISDDELSLHQYLDSPHVLVGSESYLVEKIIEQRETYGISDLVIWGAIDDGARLIRRLKGM